MTVIPDGRRYVTPVAGGTDPVASSRLPYGGTWAGLVGVEGGIPTGQTVFTTLGTSSTAAQINSAIASCPSGQVVALAAGTFSINASLTANTDGKVLRGAVDAQGRPATIFNFTSGSNHVNIFKDEWWFDESLAGEYTHRNVNSSGIARGATSLTLTAAPTGLTAGMIALVSAPSGGGIDGDGDWSNIFTGFQVGGRAFSHMIEVVDVVGNTVTFALPWNPDYTSGLSTMQLHYRTAGVQIEDVGIENISFQVTGGTGYFSGHCLILYGAKNCWIKNCKFDGLLPTGSNSALVAGQLNYRVEVRRCEITRASSNSSSTYAIEFIHCSHCWIEDNYIHTIANVWPIIGGGCNAFSYNYFVDEVYDDTTWLSQIVFYHGSHSQFHLFEGNSIPSHYSDSVADSNATHSSHSVFLRERLPGWDIYPTPNGKTRNLHPITFRAGHNYITIVGCVLGLSGKQTVVEETGSEVFGGEPYGIYNLADSSRTTLFRRHNYDIVTGGIPGSQALTGTEAIPNSYLGYSTRPAWWPSSLPFPHVDPLNFTQSNNPALFPAGYRAANGGADAP